MYKIKQLDINKPSNQAELEEKLSAGWKIEGYTAAVSFGDLKTLVLITNANENTTTKKA